VAVTYEQVVTANYTHAGLIPRRELAIHSFSSGFRVAVLIGDVVLARAVQDHRLSEEILKSVRQKLS
jgi:hypothetical protein